MALSDEEVADVAKQIEDRRKAESRTSPLKNISPTQKIMIGVAVALIVWLAFIQKNTLPDWQKFGLLLGIGVGIIWFAGYGEEPPRMLTDRELVSNAYELLKWKQLHTLGGRAQIPPGEIVVELESMPQWRDGRMLYWSRRVIIKPITGVPIEFELRQDPYTGDLRGMIEKPEGYSGKDIPYEKTLFSKDLQRDLQIESERQKLRKQ